MFKNRSKSKHKSPSQDLSQDLSRGLSQNMCGGSYIFNVPEPGRMELQEVEKCFARLFSSEDGHKALSYLQTITFQKALAPTSSDEQLRYAEGQRAMMATILRLIDRGRKGAGGCSQIG